MCLLGTCTIGEWAFRSWMTFAGHAQATYKIFLSKKEYQKHPQVFRWQGSYQVRKRLK